MNNDRLLQLENYVEKHLSNTVMDLKCTHSETYSNILKEKFEFLPGHRKLVLNFKSLFLLTDTSTMSKLVMFPMHFENILEELKESAALSGLLKEIIESALKNYATAPNNHRYSEFIKYFATYSFLLSGRQSYELLCANLPFPSISTISKPL